MASRNKTKTQYNNINDDDDDDDDNDDDNDDNDDNDDEKPLTKEQIETIIKLNAITSSIETDDSFIGLSDKEFIEELNIE